MSRSRLSLELDMHESKHFLSGQFVHSELYENSYWNCTIYFSKRWI